jgi:hypothetical protein
VVLLFAAVALAYGLGVNRGIQLGARRMLRAYEALLEFSVIQGVLMLKHGITPEMFDEQVRELENREPEVAGVEQTP